MDDEINMGKKVVKKKVKKRRFHSIDSALLKMFLTLHAQGRTQTQAAEAVGTTRQAIWCYRQGHPEFEMELKKAEEDYYAHMADLAQTSLEKLLKKGDRVATFFALQNLKDANYQDRRNLYRKAPSEDKNKEQPPSKEQLEQRIQELPDAPPPTP